MTPSITGSSNDFFNNDGIAPGVFEKVMPLRPSGKLEVVSIMNEDIWLVNK
jgi:hypothetical protein